jgi:nucleotide-binding universal stress UspA family protein
MFKKVIWATDGSANADRAMSTAVDVATTDGAELHVVHVVEKLFSNRASGMDAFANEDQMKAKIRAQADTIARKSGLTTTTHIAVGVPDRIGNRIAEIADDTGADLIVVGTRGHGALGSLVLGGVTQRLLHVAHCPVLAVPPDAARPSPSPGETVASTA